MITFGEIHFMDLDVPLAPGNPGIPGMPGCPLDPGSPYKTRYFYEYVLLHFSSGKQATLWYSHWQKTQIANR